jgi:hypothetical protein
MLKENKGNIFCVSMWIVCVMRVHGISVYTFVVWLLCIIRV